MLTVGPARFANDTCVDVPIGKLCCLLRKLESLHHG